MKKILIFIILPIFVIIIIFLITKENLNLNKLLKKIEQNTDINILLKNQQKWGFYPLIYYKNKISINNKNNTLIIENSNISITKDYWFTTPFKIKLDSPSILYKGLNFRNSILTSDYKKNIFYLNKFTADIIDGNIDINGTLQFNNEKKLVLKGTYKNIDLNRVLKQLNIADWERVQIKISSPNFKVITNNTSAEDIIRNLNGEIDLLGSIFFVSTEEDLFGAALLSLLTDKIKNMIPLSESINYLLKNFSNKPSNISGKIFINQGILSTEKLLLENKKGKALISAILDISTNNIDGKIDLYNEDKIFLTAELRGNLQNPEILIGGELFAKDGKNKPQNIKEIFQNGIESLIDNILKINE